MAIARQRTAVVKTPNHIAVQRWLVAKYNTELKQATTEKEIKRINALYKNVQDEEIWSEYVRNPVKLSTGQFLCCFTVTDRGYGIVDAKLPYVSFSDVISYFKITVKKVNTYDDLIKAIKGGERNVLYQVKQGSGQYGVAIDNRQSLDNRYQSIIQTLNNVSVNIAVNYTGGNFTSTSPHVGELSITWPGLTTVSLEVYPVEEIISL